MLDRKELDRKAEPKTRVVVRLTFSSVDTYRTFEEKVKHLAESAKAIMAVKME